MRVTNFVNKKKKIPSFYHLVATVVDEDFQHRRLLSARIQRRQIVEGGVHRPVSPVLELARQMTSLLIFDLAPDDVLKHLREDGEADLLTFGLTASRNTMMGTLKHTDAAHPHPYLAQLGSHHERRHAVVVEHPLQVAVWVELGTLD